MISVGEFPYAPAEHEAEKASNSYLMSLVAIVVGLPLPIINLIATFFFFIGNRNSTYFVRWHCIQALLSQFSILFINGYGFWWTVAIVFGDETLSNPYISYMLTVLVINASEFIATVYTAIQTRKGVHVKWWFYGPLTDILCRPRP